MAVLEPSRVEAMKYKAVGETPSLHNFSQTYTKIQLPS